MCNTSTCILKVLAAYYMCTGQNKLKVIYRELFIEGSLKAMNRVLSASIGGESLQTTSWKCFFLNSLGAESTSIAEKIKLFTNT